MSWTSTNSWVTRLFSGDPLTILLAFVVTVSLPLILHLYLYTHTARPKADPTFLLLGTSGSGKTSLVSLLQKRTSDSDQIEPSATRTSQVSSQVALLLPSTVPLGSNKYRSKHDASFKDAPPTRYVVIDTPGHGKLRTEHALSKLQDPNLRGVIFVVDASILDSNESSSLQDAATYLHDTLLALQRRKTGKASSRSAAPIPVLVAANKQDLFTALPAGAVKERLQTEIERVRVSKSKGLAAVGRDPDADADEDILGGGGEAKFTFLLLEEDYKIHVDVVGGAVRGEEAGKGVSRWEEWIGSCL